MHREEKEIMEAISCDQFLTWASGLGLGMDPEYPDSGELTLFPRSDHSRFWVVPPKSKFCPRFIATILSGLDDWSSGLLWPRIEFWPKYGVSEWGHKPLSNKEQVRDVILRGVGIPDGWHGAIRVRREEESLLTTVFFTYLSFVDNDLFFVPDHGQQLLKADHHNVVHAQCSSEERILKLIEHMARKGYALPTEPPDWTFIRPAWMC